MWGVGGVLLFSAPPSALYWILGFLFVLFVLLNLRQSSELLNKYNATLTFRLTYI